MKVQSLLAGRIIGPGPYTPILCQSTTSSWPPYAITPLGNIGPNNSTCLDLRQ